MAANKLVNEYAHQFAALYDKTPKAVFAAVALSLCFIDVEERGWGEAIERFVKEWDVLYQNGIVPQKPVRGPRAEEER